MISDISYRKVTRLFTVIITGLARDFVYYVVRLRASIFAGNCQYYSACPDGGFVSYPLAATHHQTRANIAMKAATQIA